MTKKEIDLLINNYLEGLCNEDEKKLLEDFLESYQDENLDWTESEHGNKLELEKKLYSQIQRKIQNNKLTPIFKLKKYNNKFRKYAAVLIIGFVAAFAIYFNSYSEINTSDVKNSTEIVLELSDGTRTTINTDDSQDIVNSKGIILGKQNKLKLTYQNNETQTGNVKLTYNKIYVPYGKKFQIELSDGSLIYLNSGSTLKYPVQFIKGQSRDVFLDGEGYFKVSEDKNDFFMVHANTLNTKVFGTEFNILSYKNDDNLEVVLVEGSIGVYNNQLSPNHQKQILLVPNQKASFDKINQEITTKSINVDKYIAWKDGILVFEKERFENIIRRLERHYNVSIENNNKVLNDIRFTGSFDIENIEEVFQAFNSYKPFTYQIENNKIIINP